MKLLLLTATFFLLTLAGLAQHNHFVYVQSDNKQPFYIRLNDKVYSSSASGYAIVSKLQKGNYTFLIGFPKNEFPQQSIALTVNEDAGYMLKNFGEKGWGLYNIQTMAIVMAGTGNGNATGSTGTNTDGFSNTLAGVVNTPLVKQEIRDTEVVAKVTPAPEVKLVTESKPAAVENKITVLSNIRDNSGRSIIYIDKTFGGNDTIRVFIPYKEDAVEVKQVVQREEIKVPKTGDDKKFLNIELGNPNVAADSSAVVKTTNTEPLPEVKLVNPAETKTVISSPETNVVENRPAITQTKSLTVNSDCRAMASDDDFLKIRKKMAAEDTDEDMITAAKKMFKIKCYSTEQVKNLSLLFLKDKGKYSFFDAAYPFIHDTQNFGSLESQLSDPYYITRFKAMIRN